MKISFALALSAALLSTQALAGTLVPSPDELKAQHQIPGLLTRLRPEALGTEELSAPSDLALSPVSDRSGSARPEILVQVDVPGAVNSAPATDEPAAGAAKVQKYIQKQVTETVWVPVSN
jgi:hypothetical protein